MMNSILFALAEWLSFLVPIVFFVIWVLNQIAAGAKAAGKPPTKPNAPRRQAPAERPMRAPGQGGGPPPVAEQPAGKAAQLNQEIEQFLKRANQRRGEKPRREPAMKSPPKSPPKPPAPAPTVSPPERRDFDTVAESVAKHIASRSFTQRTEHLADDITRADQQMEQHLQQAFNRRVGTLGDAVAATAAPVTDVQTAAQEDQPTAAGGLASMLSKPESVKQAFILAEILKPPQQNW